MKFVVLFLNVFLIHLALAGEYFKTSQNEVYYIESEYQFTWYQSLLECSSRNMSLLAIENEDKFKTLYEHLISDKFPLTKRPPDLWIGGIGNNNKFIWVSSENPVTTSLWSAGNPSNSANVENCLHIHYLAPRTINCINDINCIRKIGFVCEIKNPRNNGNSNCTKQNDQGKYKNFVFNFNQKK